MTALNAETSLIAQQRALVDLQARWIDGRVGLIRALGGGFAENPAPALAAKVDPAISNK